MSPEACERGLRVMLHLVRRSAPYDLQQTMMLAARLRALLAIPIARRDPRALPQYIRKLDGECARLFGTRFEDLATVAPDTAAPTLEMVIEQCARWLHERDERRDDPHLHLDIGRYLALLGAPEQARPYFQSFGRLDPGRSGIARGWYLLASLLAQHVDECAQLLRQTRDAGDFQYADGEHYLDIYDSWVGAQNGVLRSFQKPIERLLDAKPELRGPAYVYFELALATAATGRLEAARRALERVDPTELDPLYSCAVASSPAFDAMWCDDTTREHVAVWYAEATRAHVLPDRDVVRGVVSRLLAERVR